MRQLTYPKDAKAAVREALRAGFVADTGGKHLKLRGPKGQLVVISASASDGNAAKAVIRDIKNAMSV